MHVPSEMEFWQDYKEEQALAQYSGRAFRLSLREYTELRRNELEVKNQGRQWRRTALRNLFTSASKLSFSERLSAFARITGETFQREARAGHELRLALGRGINPGAVPVTSATSAVVEDVDSEIGRFQLQHADVVGNRRSNGLPPTRTFQDYCGARTTKNTRCRNPRPCPHHGGR